MTRKTTSSGTLSTPLALIESGKIVAPGPVKADPTPKMTKLDVTGARLGLRVAI